MDSSESVFDAALRGKDQATSMDDETVGSASGYERVEAESALEWSGTAGKKIIVGFEIRSPRSDLDTEKSECNDFSRGYRRGFFMRVWFPGRALLRAFEVRV